MSEKLDAACQALAKGEFIILTDRRREHEADLMLYGPAVTPEKMNFLIRYTSGVVVIPMVDEDLNRLELPQMVENNTERYQTAFTISVDAAKNTTSGVSASDRTNTVLTLCDPSAKPTDLRRPGHIFPLRAHPEGVLGRQGHTEASVDLLKIANLQPVAIVCEMLTESGSIMGEKDALAFHKEFGFPMIDIEDIISHRQKQSTAHSYVGVCQS